MTQDRIREMQARVGTTPDGFWGPKSIAACQKHLRALMPKPNPWPKTDQASLTAFYGPPGDEDRLVSMPVPQPVTMFYEGKMVRTIRCHEKVALSLGRALVDAYDKAPFYVRIYDGCYNNRPMRGGSLPSLHARGAAIDLSASSNGLHAPWPTVATMPIEVMEAFAREGWVGLGWAISRDAMHFQSTK